MSRTFKSISVVAAGLLTGCGGSDAPVVMPPKSVGAGSFIVSTTTPSPVSSQTSYALSDEIGETFRVFFAEVADGPTTGEDALTNHGIIELTTIDNNTVELTLASGATKRFILPAGYVPVPIGTSGLEYVYVAEDGGTDTLEVFRLFKGGNKATFRISEANKRADTRGSIAFGFLSDPVTFPAMGTYTGASDIGMAKEGEQVSWRVGGGTTTLTADFSAGTLSGTLFSGNVKRPGATVGKDITISVNNATITGNQFHASDAQTVVMTDAADPVSAITMNTSEAAGQFSGSVGQVVLGAYAGGFTATESSGQGEYTYSGSIRASDKSVP